MGSGLFLPDGSFQPFRGESLSMALATRKNAEGFSDLWLDQLPDPDPILRKRGDDAAILKDLSADDQVTVAMLARKNRVLNCPHFAFRPGAADGEEPTPIAESLYHHLMEDLERTNLRSVISGALDAPFYGFTPLEILWKAGGDGWWHILDIVPRPPHWFAFDAQNNPIFRGEDNAALYDEQFRTLPAGKFVFVSHHATYDNPYGIRLLSRCLWPVMFKRGGLQFYARFAEKYGQPWLVLKAPSGASPEAKRTMAGDLARMVRDCLAVIPFGSDMQFLTASNTQSDLHERFLARQDRAISKLLMGQTLTVELEGANNSQAASTVHQDVAESLADADKAMVADAFNEIAWLYARVNTAPDVLAPLFSYEEPEDLAARAELDKKLWDMGVRFKPQHFQENYNLKEEEFDMENSPSLSFASPQGQRGSSGTALLAEQAQTTLETALEKMLPRALSSHAHFRKQLENVIHNASSFEELEEALGVLLAPSMEPSELEDFLARAMTAAAGFGATAVHAEQENTEGA